ncbi:MAG TPA: hypothetical protein DEH78_10475 [Solibacterales bacterium]|nr:hypothetical protein [Bryobacterales bacterium]
MRLLAISFTLLAFSACNLVRETPARHAVHKGEKASLFRPKAGPVWVAGDRETAETVSVALVGGDTARLFGLEKTGKAFPADPGTTVTVVAESFNERHVRVTSGRHAGKEGWVPYEWLRPAREGN